MKHFHVFVALWHIGASMVLPTPNPTAIAARHADSNKQFPARDVDGWQPLLQSRGKAPYKPSVQSVSGNSMARSYSAQLEPSSNFQREKSPRKRDRLGVPFSPPPIRSLDFHKSDTNSHPADKAIPLSSQTTSFKRHASSNHLDTGHITKPAGGQQHSNYLGSPKIAHNSPADYQHKEIPSNMVRNTMPPPPPRPNRHVVMGYPVDSIIGRNWAGYENPLMEKPKLSDSPYDSTKPDSGPTLTRRVALGIPNLSPTNYNAVIPPQHALNRRGCSPSSLDQCGFFSRTESKKRPVVKRPDAPGQPSSSQSDRKPRVRFWLPGNIATRSSQPLSDEVQRRPGLDLSSKQKSSSTTPGRNAPVPSVYETTAYFRDSWRHSHDPPPTGADTGHIHKRSAAPGREAHPQSSSVNSNSPTRFPANHRTLPQHMFRGTTPPPLARDPVAEEALRNAAARASSINRYPLIDHRLAANGQVHQPPQSPSRSTYPLIPPPITPPIITPLRNGPVSHRSSDSDSPRRQTP